MPPAWSLFKSFLLPILLLKDLLLYSPSLKPLVWSTDHTEGSPPYYIPSTSLVFDMEAYWNINDSISLNASINNLTNETYFNFQDVRGRDGSRGDILRFSQPERNFQIGAKFTF